MELLLQASSVLSTVRSEEDGQKPFLSVSPFPTCLGALLSQDISAQVHLTTFQLQNTFRDTDPGQTPRRDKVSPRIAGTGHSNRLPGLNPPARAVPRRPVQCPLSLSIVDLKKLQPRLRALGMQQDLAPTSQHI